MLLYLDSFDHFATADLTEKWTTAVGAGGSPDGISIVAAAGRRGSAALRYTHSNGHVATGVTKTLTPSGATAIIGVAVTISTTPFTPGGLVAVRTGTTTQVTLRLNTDLTLDVRRGGYNGTSLGVTTTPLGAGSAVYLEWKVLIHASAGTVDVRINGVSAPPFPLTGLNTRNAGTADWTAVALGQVDSGVIEGGAAWNADYDDLYVCDGSGAAPWNDLLGDCRVDVRTPTAAGATTGWTPLAGANYAAVDDAAPDDDSTYTETSTTGATDTFVTEDAPVAGATIYGVQHCLSMKKTGAGTCTVAPVTRHSGVDYPGAALAPGTTYAYGLLIAQTNPGTSAAWTESGFNAAEFGYKRVS